MANIKEVRNRIKSVTATQQITKAMKMVAAAKLGKAHSQILQLRPYAEKLTTILGNILARIEQELVKAYTQERPMNKLLLVVISSDRGLCGAFNINVFKKTLSYIQETCKLSLQQVTLLPIGKKAFDYFQKRNFTLIKDYAMLLRHLNFEHTRKASEFIVEAFQTKTYDRVILVYSEFKHIATQVLKVEQFLPIIPPPKNEGNGKIIDYIYEPTKDYIVEKLVPQLLKTQFYKALLESNASEQGARMTAMSKATDNADELLKELSLTYNRTRQTAITKEIIEIVAGAEALSRV
ncbi:MAG: ATP synthase F1 subunit gamma [Cytophagales bacterium]|nr:ATP synthase F1 subunit gamma [Cytophagales bacterium]